MAKAVTAYKARDGALFESREACQIHDDIGVITAWVQSYINSGLIAGEPRAIAEAICTAKEFSITVLHQPEVAAPNGHGSTPPSAA